MEKSSSEMCVSGLVAVTWNLLVQVWKGKSLKWQCVYADYKHRAAAIEWRASEKDTASHGSGRNENC